MSSMSSKMSKLSGSASKMKSKVNSASDLYNKASKISSMSKKAYTMGFRESNNMRKKALDFYNNNVPKISGMNKMGSRMSKMIPSMRTARSNPQNLEAVSPGALDPASENSVNQNSLATPYRIRTEPYTNRIKGYLLSLLAGNNKSNSYQTPNSDEE